MTSVGSGSLILVVLLALCLTPSAAGLVGTDLVQAVALWWRPQPWDTCCSGTSAAT